jgi:hypothetical protein
VPRLQARSAPRSRADDHDIAVEWCALIRSRRVCQ